MTSTTYEKTKGTKSLGPILVGCIAGATGMWAYLESNASLPGPLARNTMTSYLSCMANFSSDALNIVDQLQASQICTNRHQRRLFEPVGDLKAGFDVKENRVGVVQENSNDKLVTSVSGTLAIALSPEGELDGEYRFQANRTAIGSAVPASLTGTFDIDLPAEINDLPWCSEDAVEGRCKTWWSDEVLGLLVR